MGPYEDKVFCGSHVSARRVLKPNGIHTECTITRNILLFLDDVIIFRRKFEEQLESLAAILRRLKKGDLKNKRSKRSLKYEKNSQHQTTAGSIRNHWVLPKSFQRVRKGRGTTLQAS